jgi:glycosyltransferase involved in cell wall biosynthesis
MNKAKVRKITNVCMIAYTNYTTDARTKREAETLVHHGFNVLFLSLREENEPKIANKCGVLLRQINTRKFIGKNQALYCFSYIDFIIRTFLVVSYLTLKGQIDAVHVHNMPDFLVFAAVLPRLLGKKIVLDIHDSMPETYAGKFSALPPLFSRLLIWEEKFSARFANRIICVNHIQMQPLVARKIPQEKITVCMNVPDHTIFTAANCNVNRKIHDSFNVVYHGTIDTTLGIDLAIRAMVPLSQKIPTIKFHIIGRGKDAPDFQKLILELGLANHIDFKMDMFPVAEVPVMLRDMHVGLIPNRKNRATELMLPVKLLEYVSLGIPTVAPRLRAIQYYFTEEMLGYYEPENVEDMANAVYLLYSDESRRTTLAQRALTMLDRYGWEKHQYDLVGIYR